MSNGSGMVERRPTLGVLAHVVLIVGVTLVAFPIYLAFVASTHTTAEITASRPLSLVPGTQFVARHGE